MFEVQSYTGTKSQSYEQLLKQLDSLLEGEVSVTANLANASALLNQFLDNVNWVGFYTMNHGELVLGPFQGLPACVKIPNGKGVCGTATQERATQLVPDVHQFPGHIACDAQSQSEIVVPIIVNDEIFGVLDIDAPIKERFDETDQHYLEKFVETLKKHL
ncbi:GAF domain-containing protein [Alkalibacillus almallahensis]|uniref:GAF domain-containing protein n=1 Tax=Alkalibacillus almallahensis TaxID=1379154 RepID=UPI00141E8308|nr:GAF domain-containing protein [Alkalibacillus almallahensis]NIK11053.1 GAF domain-containing protein [Alkalibacillus almallahensis]